MALYLFSWRQLENSASVEAIRDVTTNRNILSLPIPKVLKKKLVWFIFFVVFLCFLTPGFRLWWFIFWCKCSWVNVQFSLVWFLRARRGGRGGAPELKNAPLTSPLPHGLKIGRGKWGIFFSRRWDDLEARSWLAQLRSRDKRRQHRGKIKNQSGNRNSLKITSLTMHKFK